MASGGKSPPELLICSICTEPYDDNQHKAKFLTCYHTFCFDCLNEWRRKKSQINVGSIQCPNCNQLTDVPDGGIAGLQTNFYIESMKEISKKYVEPKPIGSTEGCPEHSNQPKSFFCETCNMAICRDCTVLDHQKTEGHIITGIKKATDTQRHILEEQLLRSHAIQHEIRHIINEIVAEMKTIEKDKDSVMENLTAFIQFAQCQLQQCQQEATDAIFRHHGTKQHKLLGKQRQLQQAKGLLEKHISQSEKITKIDDISDIISSREKLENATEITRSDVIDQRKNLSQSDLISGTNLRDGILCNIGNTCFHTFLPNRVVLQNDEITAGLQSVIVVELLNNEGTKVPIARSFLNIKITDPQQEELPITLNTNRPKCTVTFTPQVSGKHKISLMCLGQKLKSEQNHILVKSNNPVLKFGKKGDGNGAFNGPWGIAMDTSGVLYVTDRDNRLIQKFSGNGEYMNQFHVNVHDKDCSILDMALDHSDGLIFCVEIGLKDGEYSQRTNMIVFNLEGVFQHSFCLNDIAWPVFISFDKYHSIIMSDITNKCLCKFDKQGKYLGSMGNFKYPAYITTNDDDSLIVTDKDNDCVYIFNSNGTVRHKFGNTGTGKGQLKKPHGVATDGEYILVADSENDRIQVFNCNGQFVSILESKDDPLNSPRGLVTRDGYVYATDNGNNCIKKYRYK